MEDDLHDLKSKWPGHFLASHSESPDRMLELAGSFQREAVPFEHLWEDQCYGVRWQLAQVHFPTLVVSCRIQALA